jgi:PhnB protein
MPKLQPYIFSDDARKQAQFYVEALKGEIVSVQTFGEAPQAGEENKDKVMHLVLQAAGLQLFMADSVSRPIQPGNQIDLTIIFTSDEEAREAFEGLSQGGQVLMPFERMFWGTMFGRVVDPFGIRWQIATERSE